MDDSTNHQAPERGLFMESMMATKSVKSAKPAKAGAASSGSKPKFGSPEWRAKYGMKPTKGGKK